MLELNSPDIETRYPGDYYDGFTWKDARDAFQAALKIKNFIIDKII